MTYVFSGTLNPTQSTNQPNCGKKIDVDQLTGVHL